MEISNIGTDVVDINRFRKKDYNENKNFYEEKINTAKYFFDKVFPRIDSHYQSAITGSDSIMKAKFH